MPSVSRLSRENVGPSVSHNPIGLHRLLQGSVTFFFLPFTPKFHLNLISRSQHKHFWPHLCICTWIYIYLSLFLFCGIWVTQYFGKGTGEQSSVVGFILVALAVKIEAVHSSEMSVNFCWTMQCHIREFRTLHSHGHENLKSNLVLYFHTL
jgi:hypothetical protein